MMETVTVVSKSCTCTTRILRALQVASFGTLVYADLSLSIFDPGKRKSAIYSRKTSCLLMKLSDDAPDQRRDKNRRTASI